MADTFTCEWINRLDQYGRSDFSLIVVHDQGIIPTVRIEKNFNANGDYTSIDDDFLGTVAIDEVERIVQEWNLANPPEP
jgi:hypothetical protein